MGLTSSVLGAATPIVDCDGFRRAEEAERVPTYVPVTPDKGLRGGGRDKSGSTAREEGVLTFFRFRGPSNRLFSSAGLCNIVESINSERIAALPFCYTNQRLLKYSEREWKSWT